MQIDKQCMLELSELVANAVVSALKKENVLGNSNTPTVENKKAEKSAYAKTEALLYNYKGFQKIVREYMDEIENIRKYGVPKRSGSIVEYSPHTGSVGQLMTTEETVESAVHNIECTVQGTVQAIARIDKCMAALRTDPYYRILELRYFDGRTQEDIALEFNCSQVTISNNKNRLVRELSMRLFPDQVINEMFG